MKPRKMSMNRKRNRNTKRAGKRRLTMQYLEARDLMAVAAFGADLRAPLDGASQSQPVAARIAQDNFGPGSIGPIGPIVVVDPIPPELGAKLENGVLTVTGTHEADNLFIFVEDGKVHVREVVKEKDLLSVPTGDVTSIVVKANGGDDWVNIDDKSVRIPATLYGDAGNDTLLGGAAGDTLYGGSHNDEILGRGGNDTIRGESGDDLLVGGDGKDIIFGGFGNDYLVGGAGNDWLAGEAGNDQLFGEGGNDLLFGGQGDDLMDGGDGDDALYGDEGQDHLYGGNGNDFLRGFSGDDAIRGEGGNDTLMGDDGNDLADGGDGDDSITGDKGNDVLSGGIGNDVLSGGNDQDWVFGAAGADVIYGGAGHDFLQGGEGADELNGGGGDNKLYQEYAPGQEYLGSNFRLFFGLGDIVDGIEAIGDFIADVFKWTWDKVESIGSSFWNWASNLDDRIVRLGEDIADTFTNWPWKAEFWKGLGRSVLDALEIAGLSEAWTIAFEILKPWQRGLTDAEVAVARSVFGDSIPWDRVRLDEYSLMAAIGRTHVTGYIINSTEDLDDRTMIHELTHVWQYVTGGLVYIPEAIAGQASDDGYDYGGVADLRAKMNAGQGLSAYNPEQQGEIVADYFQLRQKIRTDYEAKGLVAPQAERDKLDVYIHFVKEVSTLTPRQLDTPDFILPVVNVGQVVSQPGNISTRPTTPVPPRPVTPSSPRPVQPVKPGRFNTGVDNIRGPVRPL